MNKSEVNQLLFGGPYAPAKPLNLAGMARAIAAERDVDVVIVITAKRGGYIPFTAIQFGRTDGLENVELRSILDSLQAGMQHKMQPPVFEETCRDGKVHD